MSSLEIDVEKCKGCELCVGACPRDVLVMTTKKINDNGLSYVVVNDLDKCNGCGNCYAICPDVCITINYRK